MQEAMLERWANTFTVGVDRAPLDEVDLRAVLGYDVGEDMVLAGMGPDETEDDINAFLMGQDRTVLAMASIVGWGPEDGEISKSWVAVVVASGLEAIYLIRRIEEDHEWMRLDVMDVPWMVLSTAGGLRKMLENNEPLVLKQATMESSRDLFNPPGLGGVPPEDEDGRI